jgi:hypothetical protein
MIKPREEQEKRQQQSNGQGEEPEEKRDETPTFARVILTMSVSYQ